MENKSYLRFYGLESPSSDFSGKNYYKSSFKKGDFNGSTFEGSMLEHCDFRKSNLKGANFCKATLKGSVFNQSNLEDADFRGAKISDCTFFGCNLKGAKFDQNHFVNMNFSHAILDRIEFKRLTLFENCWFSGADITKCKFDESTFINVMFDSANMRGCSFKFANLRQMMASYSSWEDCNISFANCESIKGIGSVFIRSRMEGINLKRSILDVALIKNCKVNDADFSDASLKDASLFFSVFNGSCFSRVSLENVFTYHSSFEGATCLANLYDEKILKKVAEKYLSDEASLLSKLSCDNGLAGLICEVSEKAADYAKKTSVWLAAHLTVGDELSPIIYYDDEDKERVLELLKKEVKK